MSVVTITQASRPIGHMMKKLMARRGSVPRRSPVHRVRPTPSSARLRDRTRLRHFGCKPRWVIEILTAKDQEARKRLAAERSGGRRELSGERPPAGRQVLHARTGGGGGWPPRGSSGAALGGLDAVEWREDAADPLPGHGHHPVPRAAGGLPGDLRCPERGTARRTVKRRFAGLSKMAPQARLELATR